MKAKEKFKELQNKSLAELTQMLAQKREQLRDLKFKVSQNQLKTVRQIRVLRNEVSRISTLITKQSKKS